MNIAILGGGSWGTALAVHLAKNKHEINVWEFFEEQAQEMQEQRVCKLLPSIKFPKNIFVSAEMKEVLVTTNLVLLAVPSDKVGPTVDQAKAFLGDQPIIICSKGLGEKGELLTEVISQQVDNELFCLYGPTHAEEVGKGMFSGAVLAGTDQTQLETLKQVIESENFRIKLSTDVIGVQVAAALKNILAVFVGVLDGLKLGDNAKAYAMTVGLAEIKELGLKLGAQEATFYGLAGMGDVIVTGTSQHSRNRYVGEQVGKGKKLEIVIKEMKMVAEGITTIEQAVNLKKKLKLDLPLLTGLADLLFKDKPAEELLKEI